MELSVLFKSVLEQDTAPVVICDLNHIIVYMNPAACESYRKYGGDALLGKNLLDCHNKKSGEMIDRVLEWFRADPSHNCVHTFYNEKQKKDVYMIALRDDHEVLIGYYEKHEFRTRDMTPLYAV